MKEPGWRRHSWFVQVLWFSWGVLVCSRSFFPTYSQCAKYSPLFWNFQNIRKIFNSILFGLPECQLGQTQTHIELTHYPRHMHTSPPFCMNFIGCHLSAHHLYKLMLITYKSLHGKTPDYISELITVKKPGSHLTIKRFHNTSSHFS